MSFRPSRHRIRRNLRRPLMKARPPWVSNLSPWQHMKPVPRRQWKKILSRWLWRLAVLVTVLVVMVVMAIFWLFIAVSFIVDGAPQFGSIVVGFMAMLFCDCLLIPAIWLRMWR